MKKNAILPFWLVLGVGTALGGMSTKEETVAKDNVSIRYKKVLKYKTNTFGLPYSIQITNLSNKPIVVGPSIISTPLASYQEIAKAIRMERKWFGGSFTLGAVLLGSMSWYLSKSMRVQTIRIPEGGRREITEGAPWQVYSGVITAGITGPLGIYLLYKLLTETQKILEAKLAKETLHAPITIQPGESIEKLFWLKNQSDQVKINFDTIQVLS